MNDRQHLSNKGAQMATTIAGVILGLALWLLIDWMIDRKVGLTIGVTRQKVFSFEVTIVSLIIASFAMTEITKIARVFSHGSKSETLRLRDALLLLAVFATSLLIYGAYAFCAQHLAMP